MGSLSGTYRLLGVALTAVLLPVPATATAARVSPCPPVLTDRSGDSYAPELDVVSGDIRSSRKVVTVTLSVAGRPGINTLPGSKEWLLSWVLGAKAYQVRRRDDIRTDGGYDSHYVFADGHNAYDFAPAAIRLTPSSIEWNIPRAWLPELKKAASRTFVNVRASTSSLGFGFDSASTSRVYVDGAACSKEAPPK
jgi:hypothetical protein